MGSSQEYPHPVHKKVPERTGVTVWARIGILTLNIPDPIIFKFLFVYLGEVFLISLSVENDRFF